MTFNKADSLQSRRELLELFKLNNTRRIFVIQKSVSRSGMTRGLELYIFIWNEPHQECEPIRITHQVARALQWPYNEKTETLTVSGCGMDMHFHTVYSLSCLLYCHKHYNQEKAYYLKNQTI